MVLPMFIHKIRELASRDGKLDKTAASKRDIKTTDCGDRTLNPREQSITKTTDHRHGNSTILLKLNSLSSLNYSVNFFPPVAFTKAVKEEIVKLQLKSNQKRRRVFLPLSLVLRKLS